MAYLNTKQLCQRLNNCSQASLWRWQQENQKLYAKPLPKPVKRSNGSPNLWDENEINEWEQKYFRNAESLVT